MNDSPSSAAEIREQLEAARRTASARQQIRKLLDQGKTLAAAAVANALGDPLPRHQVVRVDFAARRLSTNR